MNRRFAAEAFRAPFAPFARHADTLAIGYARSAKRSPPTTLVSLPYLDEPPPNVTTVAVVPGPGAGDGRDHGGMGSQPG